MENSDILSFEFAAMSNFQVPTFAYEKRLSRIETLRLAITYISFMGDLLSTAGGSGVVKSRSTDLGTMKELSDHMQVSAVIFFASPNNAGVSPSL